MPRTEKEKRYVKKLGASIVAIRKEKGISQAKLSEMLDMDDGSLRRIESGRTNPTALTLYRIARVLEIRVAELFAFDK